MHLALTKTPVAEAEMLIRKPANAVYEAFIDPSITTRFWFTKSTGRLEVGKRICWEWEMYGASALVEVKQLVPGKRILLEWGLDDQPSMVEWLFKPHGQEATFVSINNSGFTGDADAVIRQAMDSAAGFTLVLAELKAYLEFEINLGLIADRFPDQIISGRESAKISE